MSTIRMIVLIRMSHVTLIYEHYDRYIYVYVQLDKPWKTPSLPHKDTHEVISTHIARPLINSRMNESCFMKES